MKAFLVFGLMLVCSVASAQDGWRAARQPYYGEYQRDYRDYQPQYEQYQPRQQQGQYCPPQQRQPDFFHYHLHEQVKNQTYQPLQTQQYQYGNCYQQYQYPCYQYYYSTPCYQQYRCW